MCRWGQCWTPKGVNIRSRDTARRFISNCIERMRLPGAVTETNWSNCGFSRRNRAKVLCLISLVGPVPVTSDREAALDRLFYFLHYFQLYYSAAIIPYLFALSALTNIPAVVWHDRPCSAKAWPLAQCVLFASRAPLPIFPFLSDIL